MSAPGETLVVRAPATTANLGPGFDCAGAALDLWNELRVEPADGGPLVTLEGEGAGELPTGEEHLALRAFALACPLAGRRFRFVNRIPLERGLGSSAATVAAGVVAGLAAAGRQAGPEEALELGLPLEGHADNLAPALYGGVCLSWADGDRTRARRVATDLPLAPIAVVPGSRVNTSESRGRLPESLPHADAAAAAAQAALLGAALASGDAELLADAFRGDRLHEPYRLDDAPLLAELRREPAPGQRGVTLSGSGPTVVVWAEKGEAAATASALERRFPDARVLALRVAAAGAVAVPDPRPAEIGASS